MYLRLYTHIFEGALVANLTRANAWRDLSPLREELSTYGAYRWNGGW